MKGSTFWNSWGGRLVAVVGFLAAVATIITGAIGIWQVLPHPASSAVCQGFSDDFQTASLNSKWTPVEFSPNTQATYAITPGELRLTAPSGVDLFHTINFAAPRILEPASGNFSIETTVSLSTVANIPHLDPVAGTVAAYQGAGLLIWQDQNTYIRLEQGYRDDQHDVALLAYAHSLTQLQEPASETELTLELQRHGDDFTASWIGGDGAVHTLGTAHVHFATTQVGLLVVNNSGNPANVMDSATFKGFTVSCG